MPQNNTVGILININSYCWHEDTQNAYQEWISGDSVCQNGQFCMKTKNIEISKRAVSWGPHRTAILLRHGHNIRYLVFSLMMVRGDKPWRMRLRRDGNIVFSRSLPDHNQTGWLPKQTSLISWTFLLKIPPTTLSFLNIHDLSWKTT